MSFKTIQRPSNKADWAGSIYVCDSGSGDRVNTSDATSLTIEIEDPDTGVAVLTGRLGAEVTVVDATSGEYAFRFTASQMSQIKEKTYWFAGIIADQTNTLQLFRTRINAYDGIVG